MKSLNSIVASLGVLVLFSSGCKSAGPGCRTAYNKALLLDVMTPSVDPVAGSDYFLNGILYSEWEDQGLIAAADFPLSELEIYKLSAFCYNIRPACGKVLRREWRKRGGRSDLVQLVAVVTYNEPTGPYGNVPLSRCPRGALAIKSIVSVKAVPDERP